MIAGNELEKLSKTAGVDFKALREKYINISSNNNTNNLEELQAELKEESKEEIFVNTNLHVSEKDYLVMNEKLDQYKICQGCQGLGTIKTNYNHMVLERTCDQCDGESIQLKSFLQNISDTC